MQLDNLFEAIGRAVDAAGIGIIVLGALLATVSFFTRWSRFGLPDAYASYRRGLGRAILLGLELLVAADIIRTVAVTPTLESVASLALIVLIRTFLSFSLELEIEGRWPWQRRDPPPGGPA